jgi:hypothetical protein
MDGLDCRSGIFPLRSGVTFRPWPEKRQLNCELACASAVKRWVNGATSQDLPLWPVTMYTSSQHPLLAKRFKSVPVRRVFGTVNPAYIWRNISRPVSEFLSLHRSYSLCSGVMPCQNNRGLRRPIPVCGVPLICPSFHLRVRSFP